MKNASSIASIMGAKVRGDDSIDSLVQLVYLLSSAPVLVCECVASDGINIFNMNPTACSL